MKQILFITYFPLPTQITVDDPEINDYWVKAESLKYTVENSFLWNSTYFKRYKE
jgi:hypothetical protein